MPAPNSNFLQTFGHLPFGWLFIAILAALAFLSFYLGRSQLATISLQAGGQKPNSQPNYHGYFLAIYTVLPATIILLLYVFVGETYVRGEIASELPTWLSARSPQEVQQFIDRISEHASMRDHVTTGNAFFDAACDRYAELSGQTRLFALTLALIGAGIGIWLGRRKISLDLRARQVVEQGIKVGLFLCAAVAVMTTLGIVLSLVFETVRFFAAEDGPSILGFLFGT